MKFMVLKPIWSKQRQAYFMPGAEIELDVTEKESSEFVGVLQPLEIAEALQPLEIVEATPKDQPAQPEQDRQVELPVKKARK